MTDLTGWPAVGFCATLVEVFVDDCDVETVPLLPDLTIVDVFFVYMVVLSAGMQTLSELTVTF